jgi:signal transduction histidine kinase
MGEDRRSEGSGLGLAISREIVERLGGRIGFDDAQGGGTVFWFDLPGTLEAATT